MKIIKIAFISFVMCLLFVGQVSATAMYEVQSHIGVAFDQLPDSMTFMTDIYNHSGTGEHDESIVGITTNILNPYSYDLSLTLGGHAGNDAGTLNGTSSSSKELAYYWTFDFGTESTALVINLFNNIGPVTVTAALPGETGSASEGHLLLFDDQVVLFNTAGFAQYLDLTGTHKVQISQYLAGSAIANYYSAVPEPSTLLLLCAGLGGVGLLRRRFKK